MKRHNLKKKFFFNKFLILIFNFNKYFLIKKKMFYYRDYIGLIYKSIIYIKHNISTTIIIIV